ncbi:MAG: VTT domain-containing protein [Myxococcota bacterium]|nr:VTT domain-containing protein [Myxococcota bacterium]
MTKASRKWLGFTGLAIGLVALGIFVRGRLGIGLDPESIREWVLAMGPIAPVICVALVAGRSFVGLPSQVVLVVAGLCFGFAWGTLYGALGLEISGLITFQLSRMAGRDAVHRAIPDRIRPLIQRAGERPGALFVTLATGYPIGVLTAYHALAGVTPMKLGVFTLALGLGAIPRAATYAYFGNSLMAGELKLVLIATGVILALLALPLLFPSGRRFLKRVVLGKGAADEDSADLNPPAPAED